MFQSTCDTDVSQQTPKVRNSLVRCTHAIRPAMSIGSIIRTTPELFISGATIHIEKPNASIGALFWMKTNLLIYS